MHKRFHDPVYSSVMRPRRERYSFRNISIVGMIVAVGVLVLLKTMGVGKSMMRISDLASNTIVMIGAIIVAGIIGVIEWRKSK